MSVAAITRTEARAEYGRALARLRSTGTKVSEILGHDRLAGEIRLEIKPPAYVERFLISPTRGPFGYARLTRGRDERIFITTPRPPYGSGPRYHADRVNAIHLIDAARLLHEFALRVDSYEEV